MIKVSILQTTIEVVGWMLFAIWALVSGIPSLWMIGRSLKRQSDRMPDPAEWPFVSVVVPARDEGHKIEAGLRSLLASDYPNYEVIAIDDRSRDETGAIMDRLAERSPVAPRQEFPSVHSTSESHSTSNAHSESLSRRACEGIEPRPSGSGHKSLSVTLPDGRGSKDSQARSDRATLGDRMTLKVIHITELPDGWLGKNHALQVGSQQATGAWILFTDGDVVHDPGTLRRAARFAIARGIDHLTLFPDIEAAGIFEASFVACFGLIFAAGTQPMLIPTRWPRFYAGVGAFNLVRRAALVRANGFEPIRLDVLDDVKLGKLLKRTGSKTEVLRSADGLCIRWQQSAWACITGLEKNAFASANYSVLQLLWMCSVTAFVIFGPAFGAIFAGTGRTGYVAAAALSHLLFGFNSALFGHSFWLFPMLLPSGAAFLFAFLRSGWITLRQGGVRWRDTFYPLDRLRKNVYR